LVAPARPALIFVCGTDHNGNDHPFTLTRKDYETPLGAVPTDVALVDEIEARVGAETLFADELHHRSEHSIEFQAVWLRRAYGAAPPPVLPVLCGSRPPRPRRPFLCGRSPPAAARGERPAAAPRAAGFLEALARGTAGRRVLVVAGADLAHVGPRFGDGPMLAPDRRRVEDADRAALA